MNFLFFYFEYSAIACSCFRSQSQQPNETITKKRLLYSTTFNTIKTDCRALFLQHHFSSSNNVDALDTLISH